MAVFHTVNSLKELTSNLNKYWWAKKKKKSKKSEFYGGLILFGQDVYQLIKCKKKKKFRVFQELKNWLGNFSARIHLFLIEKMILRDTKITKFYSESNISSLQSHMLYVK